MLCACVLTVMSLMPSTQPDLLVGHSLAHPPDDFAFAPRQPRMRLVRGTGRDGDAHQLQHIRQHLARCPQLAAMNRQNGANEVRRRARAREASGPAAAKHVGNPKLADVRVKDEWARRQVERRHTAHQVDGGFYGQNWPCSPAQRDASAARCALGWMPLSGKSRYERLTFVPYLARTALTVFSTLRQ